MRFPSSPTSAAGLIVSPRITHRLTAHSIAIQRFSKKVPAQENRALSESPVSAFSPFFHPGLFAVSGAATTDYSQSRAQRSGNSRRSSITRSAHRSITVTWGQVQIRPSSYRMVFNFASLRAERCTSMLVPMPFRSSIPRASRLHARRSRSRISTLSRPRLLQNHD